MVRLVGEGIAAAASALAGVTDTPRLDAELLMAHALGVPRDTMLLAGLDRAAPPAFAELVERRLRHEPVAYITGTRDFWTLTLQVSPAVLIPRPDSETLIEAAIEAFSGRTPTRVLDLGTGSGALLLAALSTWPQASGVGIDASPAALAVATANAAALGLADRARFVESDWQAAGGGHDLVLCNPPYVEAGAALPPEVAAHEPASALFAGADGLDDYRRLGPVIAAALAPGGVACVEIGATQAGAVSALFAAAGLACAVRRDLGGRDRCLLCRR